MISSKALSIKHWLMKIRLMFFFFAHTSSFTLLFVSGKWDKEQNIAKTFLRRSLARLPERNSRLRNDAKRKIVVCHLLSNSVSISKNLLFVSCFWNVLKYIFSHENDIHFISYDILTRYARESQTQINNRDNLKFLSALFIDTPAQAFNQLTILLRTDRRWRQKHVTTSIIRSSGNSERTSFIWCFWSLKGLLKTQKSQNLDQSSYFIEYKTVILLKHTYNRKQ